MTPWLEQITRALASARLLVRDTPVARRRVHDLARTLNCTRVPLSDQARTIQLVGGALPIDILFGQLGSETYGAVRARATRVADVLVASSPA